jgi:hypothetical protein
MTAQDQEGARQVGFALSYFTSRTRSKMILAFERFAVLAVIAIFLSKAGFALAGWLH